MVRLRLPKNLHEKEKWRAKFNCPSGTEEDHQNVCQLRSYIKKVMNEKMRLNVEDEIYPSLISKFFWKHVESKTKSIRILETAWYKAKGECRTKPII